MAFPSSNNAIKPTPTLGECVAGTNNSSQKNQINENVHTHDWTYIQFSVNNLIRETLTGK